MLENIRLCKLTEKEAEDVMNYIGSIKEELSNPMLMMYGNPELLQYCFSTGFPRVMNLSSAPLIPMNLSLVSFVPYQI